MVKKRKISEKEKRLEKLSKVINDTNHNMAKEPKGERFDNNYLYRLYLDWYVHQNYDRARIYFYEHKEQIIEEAKPYSITIPSNMYEEIKSHLFIIADRLYRRVFEDEAQVKIKSKDWEEEWKWNRFEKYYQPNQVYWYIKLTLSMRIRDYFAERKERDDNMYFPDESDYINDLEVCTTEHINNKISSEMLLSEILPETLQELGNNEKLIFIYTIVQWNSIESTSEILEDMGIYKSSYSVWKIKKKIIDIIKNIVDEKWLDINDFI